MRTLHLTLKKRWFDMIASGEKKEEYREIKDYWITRLVKNHENIIVRDNIIGIIKPIEYKIYDSVQFRNGYSKDARKMLIECNGITLGTPAFKWFGKPVAENGIIFIIQLGNIISKSF